MANTKITTLNTPSIAIGSMVSHVANSASFANNDFATLSSGSQFSKSKIFSNPVIEKITRPAFEDFSEGFSNSEPELLFAAEYIVNGINFGTLIVWEKFMNATHYELFKRNIFQSDATFQRILFLDAASLGEETSNYIDYLKNNVGLDVNADNIFVILDTTIKKDRIYEYKILASRVPQSVSEVSYGFILKSKNLTKDVVVDSSSASTLFDFSGFVLGSTDLAWTISILNNAVPFFGRNYIKNALVTLPLQTDDNGNKFVLVATDLNNILNAINDSVSLFSLKDTYVFLVKFLQGLSSDFIQAFSDSIDETKKTFSYDTFKSSIQKIIPAFNLVLQIAQSNNVEAVNSLSKLSITLPTQTGMESFASIESLTKIFNFVNNTFISALYSQDNASEVQAILDAIPKNQAANTLENALTTVITSAIPGTNGQNISNTFTNVINVALGGKPTTNNATPSSSTNSSTVQVTNFLSNLLGGKTTRTL